MKINKNNLFFYTQISLVLFSLLLTLVLQNFIPLVFGMIFMIWGVTKSYISLFVLTFLSPFLLFTSYSNFYAYIMLSVFICLFSVNFSNNIKKSLVAYLYIYTPFLIILPFFYQMDGNTYSVLTLGDRIYPRLPWNDLKIHPNIISSVAASSLIAAYITKKYLFFVPNLYILLMTQSRAGIILFFIFLIFSVKWNVRKFFSTLLFLIFFSSIIYFTPVWDRFINYSENGRLETYALYYGMLSNSFPFGFPLDIYMDYKDKSPGIDNLYLLGYLQYGVLFIYLFIVYLFYLLKNSRDDNFRIRSAIFFSILIYGFFEAAFIGNILIWPILALCFQSFSNKKSF